MEICYFVIKLSPLSDPSTQIFFYLCRLSLFWGVLIWKRKAEEALIASGLPYTVRKSTKLQVKLFNTEIAGSS